MVAVDRFVLGVAQENCYVVRRQRGAPEAVVVDPGDSPAQLRLELAGMGAHCAAILLTHTHPDHIGGVAELAEGTGAPVYVPRAEAAVLERPADFYSALGFEVQPYGGATPFEGTEALEAGGVSFETIAVPGHSPGHVAYYVDGSLFSGDVLFAGGVGRTDIAGGDWDTLLESIRALIERFPPETVVYPGHGAPTTLGAELAANPFLADLRATLD